MPLSFKTDEGRFTYRVAGIALRDDHVLLGTEAHIDFWYLPGGRPEFGETLRGALKREMLEELRAEVEVGRLALVVENFFGHVHERHHGIGLYFLMSLPEALTDKEEVYEGLEHDADAIRDTVGASGALELSFRWFHLSRVATLDVRPKCLRKALTNLSETTQHLINFEGFSD